MTQTDNYELIIVEGTDVVNPLTQFNPNFRKIDEVMKANADAGIGVALEVKSGINHAITITGDTAVFRFVATADYITGDTFSVNGDTVTVRCIDGSVPKNKAYVINQNVLCILTGTLLTLIGAINEINGVDVIYDNTTSGLTAEDVQSAIDELVTMIGLIPVIDNASDVEFNNTSSGLTATNVQDAIDEVNSKITGVEHVGVMADGIRTNSQMLNALFALINPTKVTPNSKLKFGSSIFNICSYSPTGYIFSLMYSDSTHYVIGGTMVVLASGSQRFALNNSTTTDISTSTSVAGTNIDVYY